MPTFRLQCREHRRRNLCCTLSASEKQALHRTASRYTLPMHDPPDLWPSLSVGGAGSESDSQCKRFCLTVHDLRPGPRNRGPARIGEAPCHSQHGAHPPGYSMRLPTSLCSAVRRAITCQHFRRRKGPSGDNPHNRKTLNSGSRFVSSESSDCEPAPAQFDYWPVAGALA